MAVQIGQCPSMLVHLCSADPVMSADDVFDLDVEEHTIETVSGNYEYIFVAEVDSLDEVAEASQQGRIIVEEPSRPAHYDGAAYVVTEYNNYVE